MSHPSRTVRRPVQRSGRIIGRFVATRAIAWGQPDLGDTCFVTTNTVIYVWKGVGPTFNLFLVICNADPGRAQPDMITIDLQDHTLYPGLGTSAFIGYNGDLPTGLCLIFGDQAQGERFTMWMSVVFLEAAAQRGQIPFRSLVASLLGR
ncbi:hypothetical protein GSI_12584 [Ganoderma sinense ZZ0214-1]|uniref:Uncharacterized protein n=1 Tax=Ganoderma sinense ZZ0214-1 TaxID=1077348 RepID=A0A2G8RTM7_9APHY|nr:hypothetical protein GSI_12584 [Ganoderma sinense ZZ0214-1]